MSREELEKLLGGYATGTLTDEQRKALMAGALEDQGLFDQLMREQALREAFEDPAARGNLLAALGHPRRPWWRKVLSPSVLMPAASAVLVLAFGFVAVKLYGPSHPRRVEQAAVVQRPVEPAPPAAVPAPEPPAATAKLPRAGQAPEPRRQVRLPQPSPAAPAPTLPPPPQIAAAPPPPQQTVVAPPPPPPNTLETVEVPAAPRSMGFRGGAAGGVVGGVLARSSAVVPRDASGAFAWTIMRVRDGDYKALAPGERIHHGDSVRIVLRVATDGFLSVWQPEGSGGRRTLFSGAVQAGKGYEIPAEGALRYDEPGTKLVYVRLSAGEEPLSEAGAKHVVLDVR